MNLIPMKKTRKNPCKADVFVLQVRTDVFFFGKVIMTDIESPDGFINGMQLIYIYDYCSDQKVIPEDLSEYGLLIAPIVVNRQPWLKRYFETIGNVAVTEKDLSIDYGFRHVLKDEYVDLQGNILDRKPEYSLVYGLGSYGIIDREVCNALKRKESIKTMTFRQKLTDEIKDAVK